MIRARRIPLNVAMSVLAGVSAIFAAFLIEPPTAAAAYAGSLRLLILATFALGLALWLPPYLFLGASLAVLAASTAIPSFSFRGIQLYAYDVLLVPVLLRAALPRGRRPNELRILDAGAVLPTAIWALVMLAAGLRGSLSGNSLGAVARLEMPLVYLPLFYWGFRRILGEASVTIPRVAGTLVAASVGFIAYAAYARLTHDRFGNSSGSGIGVVPTTAGTLRRDYGLYSAFQVYPLLALGGLAYLTFSRGNRWVASLAAGAGLAATLLTLLRGVIFGVAAGAIALGILAVKTRWHVSVGSRLLPLVALFAVAGGLFFAYSPVAARGVAERILPGILTQSQGATGNAQVRERQLSSAVQLAFDKPFGLGFLSPDDLDTAGYDSYYLADNQWASVLAFTGWPGVIALIWLGIAIVRRSSRLPAAAPWLHPLVTASALLVLVQGFAWNVLFSLRWSLGMLALILACRIALPQRPDLHERQF